MILWLALWGAGANSFAADANVTILWQDNGGTVGGPSPSPFRTNVLFAVKSSGETKSLSIQPQAGFYFLEGPKVQAVSEPGVTVSKSDNLFFVTIANQGKQGSVHIDGKIARQVSGGGGGSPTTPPHRPFDVAVFQKLAVIRFVNPTNLSESVTNLVACAGSTNDLIATVTFGEMESPSGKMDFEVTPSDLGTLDPLSVEFPSGQAKTKFIASTNSVSNTGKITATASKIMVDFNGKQTELVGFTVSTNMTVTVPKVELDIDHSVITLLSTNKLTATVTPVGLTVSTYQFEIKRPSETVWTQLANSSSNTFTQATRVAGHFKVRATATISGVNCVSDEKDVEHQFPSYSDIVGDGDVQTATDNAWSETKAATTTTSRREEGFWIRLNTTSGKYEVTSTIIGPVVDNSSTGSVVLGSRPADSPTNPAPNGSATYSVGSFHTHTPMTYRSGTRSVGPSSGDQTADTSDDVAGVVYDYLESPAGSGSIPGGHPLDSPAQLYHSGPTRRSTPP